MREICESAVEERILGDLLKYAFDLSVYPEENIVGTVWYNICELDVKDQSDI